MQNKLFVGMMYTNFVGLLLETANYFSVKNMATHPILNIIVSRSYLIYLLTWLTLFTLYIIYVSNNSKKEKNKKRIFNIFKVLYIFLLILVIVLPLNFSNEANKIYSYGPSTQIIYYASELFILIGFISMFKNAKTIRTAKYASLFAYTAGGVVVMIIQSIHPEWLLMTSMETFITFLTYFTLDSVAKKQYKN